MPRQPPIENADNLPCIACNERLHTTWRYLPTPDGGRQWLGAGKYMGDGERQLSTAHTASKKHNPEWANAHLWAEGGQIVGDLAAAAPATTGGGGAPVGGFGGGLFPIVPAVPIPNVPIGAGGLVPSPRRRVRREPPPSLGLVSGVDSIPRPMGAPAHPPGLGELMGAITSSSHPSNGGAVVPYGARADGADGNGDGGDDLARDVDAWREFLGEVFTGTPNSALEQSDMASGRARDSQRSHNSQRSNNSQRSSRSMHSTVRGALFVGHAIGERKEREDLKAALEGLCETVRTEGTELRETVRCEGAAARAATAETVGINASNTTSVLRAVRAEGAAGRLTTEDVGATGRATAIAVAQQAARTATANTASIVGAVRSEGAAGRATAIELAEKSVVATARNLKAIEAAAAAAEAVEAQRRKEKREEDRRRLEKDEQEDAARERDRAAKMERREAKEALRAAGAEARRVEEEAARQAAAEAAEAAARQAEAEAEAARQKAAEAAEAKRRQEDRDAKRRRLEEEQRLLDEEEAQDKEREQQKAAEKRRRKVPCEAEQMPAAVPPGRILYAQKRPAASPSSERDVKRTPGGTLRGGSARLNVDVGGSSSD